MAACRWVDDLRSPVDCLYTGISSGPNAWCRVWEAFTFYLVNCIRFFFDALCDLFFFVYELSSEPLNGFGQIHKEDVSGPLLRLV